MNKLTFAAISISLLPLVGCQPGQKMTVSVAEYRQRGDHYLLSNQFDQAAENYSHYVELKPGEPDVRANYGRALLGAGRYADAAEQLQLAYSQQPSNDATLNSLADAMMKADQQEALFRLLKTNAADRGTVSDHLRLGHYCLKMGDTDTAMLAFTTAAKIDKGQTVEPQLGLFDYYMAINDRPNAERRLRMAYFLAPMSHEVRTRMLAFNPVVGPTFATVPEERGQ